VGDVVKSLGWGREADTVYYTVSSKGSWQVMSYSLTSDREAEVYLEQVDLYVQSQISEHQLKRDAITGRFILTSAEGELPLPDEVQRLTTTESVLVLSGEGIYFSGLNSEQQSQIFFYSYESREITATHLVSELYSSRFSLSHDERFIYMVIGETQDVDIAKLDMKTEK